MKQNVNQQAFFALLRAGLWADIPVHGEGLTINGSSHVDWEEVYQLAEEQSVVSIVLAGFENSGVKPPQDLLLQWIGEVQIIEQQNKSQNEYVGKLIEKLRKEEIYALLVKGQGIAQCYERPLWRSSGDIDLFLSGRNYKKTKKILMPLATSIDEEDTQELHLGMDIDNWTVELHGSLRSCCLSRMDKVIDEAQNDVFYGGNVRSWLNGKVQVFLPGVNCDVIFVFTHILKHFFNGGIGLRQICDWCRLLWTYKDSMDYGLLESRIRKMGLMTEWKTFAFLAVNTLGMPEQAMPFYSSKSRWKRKADRSLAIILKTGNFGHNVDRSYISENNIAKRKLITAWRGTLESFSHVTIFPIDTITIRFNLLWKAIWALIRGKR